MTQPPNEPQFNPTSAQPLGSEPPSGSQPAPPPPPGAEPPGTPPGGFPPADGGYNQPPPAGPPGGPSGPGGGQPPSSGGVATDAISYGWNKFTTNVVPFVLVALAACAISALFVGVDVIVWRLIRDIIIENSLGSGFMFTNLWLVNWGLGAAISILSSLAVAPFIAALIRGGLLVTQGVTPDFGAMFSGYNKRTAIGVIWIYTVAVNIGSSFFYVPGILLSVLFLVPVVAVAQSESGIADIVSKAWNLTVSQPADVLLYWLISAAALLAGACLCFVGVLVAWPVTVIGSVYLYRRLVNEPIAN